MKKILYYNFLKNSVILFLCILELLKNSIMAINKTASIADLHKIERDGEFIFQQPIINSYK